jgi:hypothetical protein
MRRREFITLLGSESPSRRKLAAVAPRTNGKPWDHPRRTGSDSGASAVGTGGGSGIFFCAITARRRFG